MRLVGIVAALNPATVMALSISGRASSLEAEAGPSLSQTFESLADLGVLNGTGCSINEDELPEQRRADTDRSCANNQQQVDAALAQCVELAKRAEQSASSGSPLFQQYFKTNDANTRNRVAQSFAKVAAGCGHDGNQPIQVECTPNQSCTLPQTGNRELAAVATINSNSPGSIRLCRSAFRTSGGGRQRRQSQGRGCGENLNNMGELLVHEMCHTTVAAHDVAYGKQNAMRLSTDDSLNNADNFALFARDIANNCGDGGLDNGNQPPNNGNNGDNEPPNGGNDRPPPTGFPGNNGGPSNRPPNTRPPTGGPPNDFPDFDNQFPNDNIIQPGGNGRPNGPSNRPPNTRPPTNGPPNDFPDFNNQFPNDNNIQPGGNGRPNGPPFSNNNNFQPGGNNNDLDFDPSIIADILGSNEFEVIKAGK